MLFIHTQNNEFGTVGAAATGANGHVASATSTGGYADNLVRAVSITENGDERAK